jgi:tripartite ATP-independent transporter DctP family solute receptor
MAPAGLRYVQYHNQPASSPLHRWLSEMWAAVRDATDGRVEVETCAQNNGIAGGDPAALQLLLAGEIHFFTLMGGLIGAVVPVAEMQGLPFVFRSHAHVFEVMDGEFGEYLRREMAARGLWALPRATFENGFRQISTRTRPIRGADDLVGLAIRTPAGKLFIDFFESLGARPVAINLNQLYGALQAGTVEAQENPLVVTEFNRLWEVQRYVSVTNHMWSGFNLLANLAAWTAIPEDVRALIERTAEQYAIRQRRDTDALNAALAERLGRRGMIFNDADTASFRPRLGVFYARWKKIFGARAWSLLEAQVGPLGR